MKASQEKNPSLLFEGIAVSKDYTLPHGQNLHVLDKIDIKIEPKEIVAIIGPSGCGKSTLLRIIAGLIPPTDGKLFYHGKKIKELLPNASMVFQNFALYPWMTVKGNIEIVLKAIHTSEEEIKKKVEEAMALIGLSDFEEAYPREISGGMKQRVGIARALVRNPELLLMDEPFSAVDAFTAEGLRSEILNIWANEGRSLSSIVLVSHDIKEVVSMADRIIVMKPSPGRVHCVMDNKLPRPRDYRSAPFLQLMDELHNIYSSQESSKTIPSSIEEPISPLLPITQDAILGFLHYLNSRGGSEEMYRIGAESHLPFEKILIVVQAAELLNFVEIPHRVVTLTESGKEYLRANDRGRRKLWRKQLLTIPLFIKIHHFLMSSPHHTIDRKRLLDFLIMELPHQDANNQLNILIRWGHFGGLFTYHKKTKLFTLH